MTKLRICRKCSRYTLMEQCAECGAGTSVPHPPRYSKEDRNAAYRRRERFSNLEAQP